MLLRIKKPNVILVAFGFFLFNVNGLHPLLTDAALSGLGVIFRFILFTNCFIINTLHDGTP